MPPSQQEYVAPRLCVVAPVHPADDVRIYQKEALTLAAAGFRVTMIAREPVAVVSAQVSIVTMPNHRSRLCRFLNLTKVFLVAARQNADVYHCHNPDTIPVAVGLRCLGKKVVYDTHEDYARRLLIREWIPRLLRPAACWAVAQAERLCARIVNGAICTQKQILTRLGPKSVLVANAPVVPEAKAAHEGAALPVDARNVFRCVYAGRISRDRGLFLMLDMLSRLNRRTPARLWLMGEYATHQESEEAKQHAAWGFVDDLGCIPQERVFEYLARSDVGFCLLFDKADIADTSPNKLYEYAAHSVPFVASDFPRWRSSFRDRECGLFVDPSDADAIEKALLRLARERGTRDRLRSNGRHFVEEVFNWDMEKEKLLSLYRHILGTQWPRTE